MLPDGGWSPGALEELRALSRELQATEGVEEVRSLATVHEVRGAEGWVEVAPILDGPLSAAEAEALRERVLAEPLHGRLATPEGPVLVLRGDRQVLAELPLEGRRAGVGVLGETLNALSAAESARGMGAAVLVVFLVLALCLRRPLPALSACLAAGAAALWTLGLFAAAGRSLDVVTLVLPTVVFVVGVCDAVHFLAAGARGGRDEVVEGLARVWTPCLASTATSALALASLGLAPMPALRELGLFAALGLVLALGSTLALSTLALRLSRPRPVGAELCARMARARGGLVLGGLLLLALPAAWAVEVDTRSLDLLEPEHPVRQDIEAVDRALGGTIALEVLVEGEVLRPDALAAVAAWQRRVVEQTEIGWSLSLVDGLARVEEVFTGARAAPPTEARVEQALLLLESRQDLGRLWQPGVLRVGFGMPNLSARQVERLQAEVLALAELPEDLRATVTGYVPLYVAKMDRIVQAQLRSFALSFVVVFLVVGLVLRRLRPTLAAIPANLLPVGLALAALGASGLPLDASAATVTAVVLGVVVDDSVHLLHRHRDTGDVVEAARQAGPALLATTLALGLGFASCLLSPLRSVAVFGGLVAIAVFAALLVDLLVLPAMIRRRS